jgi:DNA-binding NarL/FixJ family response regulator
VDGRIPVYVYAVDPITQTGLAVQLRGRSELAVVDSADAPAAVAVLAVDTMDEETLSLMRGLRLRGCERAVVVVNSLADDDLVAAVEAGACSIVWRSQASAAWLAETVVKAARGESALPPDVLNRLLKQVTRLQRTVLQPRGMALNGLSGREKDILRLAADGFATDEIAHKLSYSKRTVTSALHDVAVRYQLRNRTHTVAYAIREGLI